MVPHVTVWALLRSLRPILATVVVAFAVLVAIGGLVVLQAGRDETARADTAVLMVDGYDGAAAARLDRVVRLYLAGQVSRVVLAGNDPTAARDALVTKGIVRDKIAEVRGPSAIDQLQATQKLLQEARVTDAMLIAEPVEALRLLKIARDQGLSLRSAPTGADNTINLRGVAEEVARYLVYCFAGR
jgi:hypothetical protein